MNFYLNAGFGDPLSDADQELIERLGYQGIRQNVPNPGTAGQLVRNALDMPKAIFIVPVETPDLCQAVAHEVAAAITQAGRHVDAVIEVGNEEDLRGKRWAKDPRGWAQLVSDVRTIARDHGCASLIVSGGVSSVSRDALRWLEQSRVAEQQFVEVGYHQYRATRPEKALEGYASREAEFRALTDAAGMNVWCTESGWSTAPHHSGWGPWRKTWSYSDDQVLEFLRYEIEINKAHYAKAFTVYQLNDGPDPNNDQDRFGIRRENGSLKPQAGALRTQ